MPDFQYAPLCDHTVLKAYTRAEIVDSLCDEAIKYKTAAVCVNPAQVRRAREKLAGTGVKTCTVIGFPLGANTTAVKAFEAADAVANGAEELDMVINIGALRDGDHALVLRDIQAVVEAAAGAPVKVIIETCYLTDDEKIAAARLCRQAGAQFVKTSTGFGTGGATPADVALLRSTVGDGMQIKASSGINTRRDAEALVAAGADRLGLSTLVQLAEDDPGADCANTRNRAP